MEKYFGSIGWNFPKSKEELENFNRVFEDYQFEADENKVDPFQILKRIKNKPGKVSNIDFHKRTVLAAEIVFQLQNEYTLGHLKLHKLIFLCQHTMKMNLHVNFLKQAMGPYDPRLMRSIDSQLKKHKWFNFTRGDFPQYKTLENAGGHKEWYERYFKEQLTEISSLIEIFRKMKSDQVELVATIYACWLEAIESKMIVSDNLIIEKVYGWSEFKKKFSKERIVKAINWMNANGINPSRKKI